MDDVDTPDTMFADALLHAIEQTMRLSVAQRQVCTPIGDTDTIACAILACLASGPATWAQLTDATNASPGKVRDRLSRLRRAGRIVAYRSRVGNDDKTWYALRKHDVVF